MKIVKNYLNKNYNFMITDNFYQGGTFAQSEALSSKFHPTSNLLSPIKKKEIRFNANQYVIFDTKNNLVDFSTYNGSEDTILRFKKTSYSDEAREAQQGLDEIELWQKMNSTSTVVNNYYIDVGTFHTTITADNNFSFNNGPNSYFRLLGFTANSYSGSNTYTSETKAWSRTWNNIYIDLVNVPNRVINSVVLLWGDKSDNKLTSSAVVKLKGYTSFVGYSPTATPAFETTITIDNTKSFASKYFANQSLEFWVLEIFDPFNSGYVNVGNLILGENISIQEPDIGFTYSIKDNSDKNLNKYNIEFVNNYTFQRSIAFNLSLLDWADSEKLYNFYMEVGARYNFWFELDETDTKYSTDLFSMWCKFDESFGYAHKVRDVFNGSLSIKEVN